MGGRVKVSTEYTFAIFALACFHLLNPSRAEGTSTANTTADSTQEIITSIGITRVAHLQFGDGAQSDVAMAIDPGTSPSGAGTVSRAEFAVSGQLSHAFTVTGLPTTITMTTGDGVGVAKQIVVNDFHYRVATVGANDTDGALDASGARTVYVGATRAAIRSDQVAGTYTSTNGVTITVTYD